MKFDGNITNKKLQFDIDREVAKLSAISSGKSNDIHEYLTDNSMQLTHFFCVLNQVFQLWRGNYNF